MPKKPDAKPKKDFDAAKNDVGGRFFGACDTLKSTMDALIEDGTLSGYHGDVYERAGPAGNRVYAVAAFSLHFVEYASYEERRILGSRLGCILEIDRHPDLSLKLKARKKGGFILEEYEKDSRELISTLTKGIPFGDFDKQTGRKKLADLCKALTVISDQFGESYHKKDLAKNAKKRPREPGAP